MWEQGRLLSSAWRICAPWVRSTTYLRSHKVCSIAGGHEQPILCSQLFGKPEVTDADRFGVPRLIHVQNVTWFQVPMNNLEGRTYQSKLRGREKEGMREARATWELITRAGPTAGGKVCVLLRAHPVSFTNAGLYACLHTEGLHD